LIFLRVRAKLAIASISYGNYVMVSVCLSWCLSCPGTVARPSEIETACFHYMIA